LQAFTAAGVEDRALLVRLAEALSAKTSKLAPKHILDLFAVYEAHGLRPRVLYVELFHALIRLSRSMYAEELALTLQALARYRLGNRTVLAQLTRSMLQNMKDFRLRYLCAATGALNAMRACPQELLAQCDAQAQLEFQTVPVQELLDNMQTLPLLEYSWRPYEGQCLEELLARTKAFRFAADMDQFADPFEALRFFQNQNLLSDEFLEALCQWCLLGVHKPNVLSERRPTARQLIGLHDLCTERGLDESAALQDALLYYVESAGGKWADRMPRPLKYDGDRKYFRSPDPHEGVLNYEQGYGASAPGTSRQESHDLPGLPSLEAEVDLFVGPTSAPQRSGRAYLGTAPHFRQASMVEGVPDISPPTRKRPKASAASPLLAPEDSLVRCFTRSRKSPRPRHRRDPGLKRFLRKDMPNLPLWCQGGWTTRPKYQHGPEIKKYKNYRYPWAGYPRASKLGAARVLRH